MPKATATVHPSPTVRSPYPAHHSIGATDHPLQFTSHGNSPGSIPDRERGDRPPQRSNSGRGLAAVGLVNLTAATALVSLFRGESGETRGLAMPADPGGLWSSPTEPQSGVSPRITRASAPPTSRAPPWRRPDRTQSTPEAGIRQSAPPNRAFPPPRNIPASHGA